MITFFLRHRNNFITDIDNSDERDYLILFRIWNLTQCMILNVCTWVLFRSFGCRQRKSENWYHPRNNGCNNSEANVWAFLLHWQTRFGKKKSFLLTIVTPRVVIWQRHIVLRSLQSMNAERKISKKADCLRCLSKDCCGYEFFLFVECQQSVLKNDWYKNSRRCESPGLIHR